MGREREEQETYKTFVGFCKFFVVREMEGLNFAQKI
jgi:hypothetical protein